MCRHRELQPVFGRNRSESLIFSFLYESCGLVASKRAPRGPAVSASFRPCHGESNVGRGNLLSRALESPVSKQTPHQRMHQALVESDLVDVVNSAEGDQSGARNKRMKALEKEAQRV